MAGTGRFRAFPDGQGFKAEKTGKSNFQGALALGLALLLVIPGERDIWSAREGNSGVDDMRIFHYLGPLRSPLRGSPGMTIWL